MVQDFFHQQYVPTFFGAMPIPKPKCERFRKLRSKFLRRIERDRSWHHHQNTKKCSVFYEDHMSNRGAAEQLDMVYKIICSRIFLSSREVAGWFESEKYQNNQNLTNRSKPRPFTGPVCVSIIRAFGTPKSEPT